MTPLQRATLARLADLMIPGDGTMPAAGAVDAAGHGADRVLTIEPRHRAPLQRFLDAATGVTRLAALDPLAQADPEGFRALGIVLANAYFMQPAVRAAIGYPGQEARDSTVGLSPADHALLDRARQRPFARRPV